MKIRTWLICLAWLFAMTWLQDISRSDFTLLWCVFAFGFGLYAWLISGKINISLQAGLLLALAARVISLFFEPLLSDDYYRFVWDGMLIHQGVHPMAYTPAYLMQHAEIAHVDQYLFSMLNSQNYYSVYPPVAQWIFGLSYKINGLSLGGHVLFFKLLLIFTDALIVFLLYLLLRKRRILSNRIHIYALNPLVIIEYTGNLHMDGIMIAALLGAVVLSEKRNIVWSSLSMALSILSKMLTLVLIPFMPRHMYWSRITLFGIISVLASVVVFWISFGIHTGWLESVRLWFFSFEFNASIYYIISAIGMSVKGYNIIAVAGPALALVTIAGIAWIWWIYIRKPGMDWSVAMLAVLTLYFLMSTTVHPWYIGSLLALAVLSRHIYPIVWSCLICLSYSHYADGNSAENYWLIGIEYLLLCCWMIRELTQSKRNDVQLLPSES